MTHSCSVPGCGRSIPLHMLMCRGHWRTVPSRIQVTVYAAWHRYKRGKIEIAELRAVQQQATDAVVALVKGGAS